MAKKQKVNHTQTIPPPAHIAASRKAATTIFLSRSSAASAAADLGPGGRVVGITKGQFSLLDLVVALLHKTGRADVTVCAWTTGDNEIEGVTRLAQNGQVSSFRLLIDRSFRARRPDSARMMERQIGSDAIRQTKAHAKFALIKAGDWRIAVRCSMNFNRNPRLEQFDIDDDPAIYDFFDRVVSDLFAAIPPGFDIEDRIVSRSLSSISMSDDRSGLSAEDAASLANLLTTLGGEDAGRWGRLLGIFSNG